MYTILKEYGDYPLAMRQLDSVSKDYFLVDFKFTGGARGKSQVKSAKIAYTKNGAVVQEEKEQ